MKNKKHYLKVIIMGSSLAISIVIWRNISNDLSQVSYSNEEAQKFIESSDCRVYIPSLEGWKIESVFEIKRKYDKQEYLELSFVNGEDKLTYRCGELKISEDELLNRYPKEEIITDGVNEVTIPIDIIELDNTTVYCMNLEKYSKELSENFDNYGVLDFTVYTWTRDGVIYNIDMGRYNIKHSEVIDIIDSLSKM